MLGASALIGAMLITVGATTSAPEYLASAFGIGAGLGIVLVLVLYLTVRASLAPDELLGRVGSRSHRRTRASGPRRARRWRGHRSLERRRRARWHGDVRDHRHPVARQVWRARVASRQLGRHPPMSASALSDSRPTTGTFGPRHSARGSKHGAASRLDRLMTEFAPDRAGSERRSRRELASWRCRMRSWAGGW